MPVACVFQRQRLCGGREGETQNVAGFLCCEEALQAWCATASCRQHVFFAQSPRNNALLISCKTTKFVETASLQLRQGHC